MSFHWCPGHQTQLLFEWNNCKDWKKDSFEEWDGLHFVYHSQCSVAYDQLLLLQVWSILHERDDVYQLVEGSFKLVRNDEILFSFVFLIQNQIDSEDAGFQKDSLPYQLATLKLKELCFQQLIVIKVVLVSWYTQVCILAFNQPFNWHQYLALSTHQWISTMEFQFHPSRFTQPLRSSHRK